MQNIKIFCQPQEENDQYFFSIDNFYIEKNIMVEYKNKCDYFKLKWNSFKDLDISKEKWLKLNFENRPSMKNISNLPSLDGSIYTKASEDRNNLKYNEIIKVIRENINTESRRIYLRMCNSLYDYLIKTKNNSYDVSCLSNIHFLKDSVRLIFRASDIQNELVFDILSIYDFFIRPIYLKKKINFSVYASTSQNVKYFNRVMKEINEFKTK